MDVSSYRRFSCYFILFLCLSACASNPDRSGDANSDQFDELAQEHNPDPWEPFNRGVFKFNDKLDAWLLKPLAKGYRFITPNFVEKGVNNFFSNLGEVNGAFNNMLQWKWGKVGNNSGRFLINTTVGLAGLFDVAKHAGLERLEPESFGQTLSHWGVGPGPYFVVPFLGPSTVTDVTSLPVDWYVHPVAHSELHSDAYYALKGFEVVSTRANLLDAEELISGDKYIFIREAFLQRRNYLVNDGEVEDDFGDFDDLDDFDGDF